MKRTIILTTLALCLTAQLSMALNVTPINVTLITYNLDSLRAQSVTTQDYIAQLENLQNAVDADKDRLDLVDDQLKLEKKRYKAESKLLKDKDKQIKAQEKVYKAELKLHKSDKKALEKERKAILKNELIDSRTQQSQLQDVARRENRLSQDINACQKKMLELKTQRETLKNDLIALAEFNYQIQNKTSQLKQLRNTNKYQIKSLKTAISAEKKALKENKKQ